MNPRDLSATHVRIPALRSKGISKYECRLSNKQERAFSKWNDLVDFINFPIERSPELFSVCFNHRGEWVEFSEDDEVAHVTDYKEALPSQREEKKTYDI